MKHKIKTTVILTSLAIATLHIINRIVNAAAIARNFLNRHNGKYYEWRFGDIFYIKQGSGSPLLLLHDIHPCSSSYEWDELIKKLSKDHTVYAVDLLGCGRSDKPNITYTNFLYVQLICDFIKNVIGSKTDVAATGLTASCVVMACHTDSSLFHKIMMINPESISKLSGIPGKHSKIRKIITDLPVIGTAVYNMLLSRSNVEYYFTEKMLNNPFKMQPRYPNIYYEAAHLGESGGKYLLSSINGLYLNINITKALSEINNSIFITAGKNCENIESTVKDYLEINPAIESEYIEHTKMLPQIEAPNELYDQMSIFF